jgi:hypothetical protein
VGIRGFFNKFIIDYFISHSTFINNIIKLRYNFGQPALRALITNLFYAFIFGVSYLSIQLMFFLFSLNNS